MRIAIVTETFLPKIDGIVTMVLNTVACLRARGDEVLVFAPGGGPQAVCGAQVIGMPSVRFPFYPELRVAAPRASMRRQLQAFQPDIFHLFEPSLLGVGGIYYGRALNVPVVISCHTNLPAYVHYYKLGFIEGSIWSLMRVRHRGAELNLCTSTVTLSDLQSHGIDRLALWDRAVDAQRFHPSKRSREMRWRLSQGEPEKPLLLHVGRLSAEKDVASLRAVMEALPEARLAIVGDGPVRHELERHFAGVRTHFTGYLVGEELAAAYASADLFVMPSRTETLGLVILEAMASGCPVVACRDGGIPDAVEHEVTGLLCDPADRDGLARTVRRALTCGAELEAIRTRAREDVERRSWQEATDRLRVHYQQAIADWQQKPARARLGGAGRLAQDTALAVLRRALP
ncbi:MAG TPA: glycosyltransferase [Acidobacteriaceae bacterium]|nr:glycosyltransferase [Acidobacteriaceae bacterium]